MSERQAFLDRLKEDFEDIVTRKVFADWLDEHDEPELANFHRSWNREKYDEASVWMEDFGSRISEEDFDDVMVPDLVDAGWKYVRERKRVCLSGLGFTAESLIRDGETRVLFWKHWAFLAETVICPDSPAAYDGMLFQCSC